MSDIPYPQKFRFTKNEKGNVSYYDMEGNPIDPPPPDLKITIDHYEPWTRPITSNKTQGKAGLNAMSSLTKNRVFIR
jgi:hypothetical protein